MKEKQQSIAPVQLVEGPLPPTTLTTLLQEYQRHNNGGAYDIFLGQIRPDQKQGQQVKAIEYSVYTPMARQKMEAIREEVLEGSVLHNATIWHSYGRVKTGELSFLVLLSADHRQTVMQWLPKVVDRVKAEVPIWKKEILTNNKQIWK